MDFVIGSFLPPTDEEKSKGFVGMNATILRDNLYSDYRDGNTFFKTFAVFFPAVTGIVAGANLRLNRSFLALSLFDVDICFTL